MQKPMLLAVALLALTATGCKKTVPNDIVEKSLRGALRTHSPNATSAMCGLKVKGISVSSINVKSKNKENIGVAHVKGTPLFGGSGSPPFCEGDIEFRYTYTSKTTGARKKTTTTTWYLEHVKLLSIQTPGVANATVEEDPDGDEDE